jgi:hypothetical protein
MMRIVNQNSLNLFYQRRYQLKLTAYLIAIVGLAQGFISCVKADQCMDLAGKQAQGLLNQFSGL